MQKPTLSIVGAPSDVTIGAEFRRRLREGGSAHSAQRGESLFHEGDETRHVLLIATGFVAAVKRMPRGLQQNVAIYVPGDIVDHEGFTLGASRSGALSLTALSFYRVPHKHLRKVLVENADHANHFWQYVAFHGALAHEWLLSLGRRSAYARMAHLLCEIIYRTSDRMNVEQISCVTPMTQGELADTLGISLIHVYRILSRLRSENLIRLQRGRIDVVDWARLKKAADFNPEYLQAPLS